MSRRFLRSDNLERRAPAADRGYGRGAAPFLFALVSLALLALSWFDHSGLREARWKIVEWMTPLLSALQEPLEPIRSLGRQAAEYAELRAELEQLRAENERLKSWEWRAQDLERRLADVSALARAVPAQPLPFLTAKVVANSSGPFVRSSIIDAGRGQGVKSGYPVIGAEGLVGRVLESGNGVARILLLTDHNSRIPVLVGRDGARAILIGDNSGRPRLDFLGENVRVSNGDDVSTSGVGGMFPRGLRIGQVIASGPAPRVAPLARLDDLVYVSVLMYDSPDTILDGDKRAPDGGEHKGPRTAGGEKGKRM